MGGGEEARMGISNNASERVGDSVCIGRLAVGKRIEKGKEAAGGESVKAASEIYSPADGEVTAVNEALADEAGMVNGDAEGNGWFFKMKLSNPGQVADLMDEAAYKIGRAHV